MGFTSERTPATFSGHRLGQTFPAKYAAIIVTWSSERANTARYSPSLAALAATVRLGLTVRR
jgi:hypothetical protein